MQNIVLVGPMGAGKSTVGRGLALLLKREFVDSDQEIEKRTGVDIPTIFEFEGEEGFRHRETEMLRELLGREDVVLATGGGIVMRPENRELLQQHCVLYPNYCRTPTLWTGTQTTVGHPPCGPGRGGLVGFGCRRSHGFEPKRRQGDAAAAYKPG